MQYNYIYESPLGCIHMSADETGLTELFFDERECDIVEYPVFENACKWLDLYFAGKEPDFLPKLHIIGTPFQLSVWRILQKIPYGNTITYGDIANKLATQRGIKRMSAQAVGGAVGHNKIPIIIPCHRVIGANGNLTGFGCGMDRKIALLKLENVNMERMYVPNCTIQK